MTNFSRYTVSPEEAHYQSFSQTPSARGSLLWHDTAMRIFVFLSLSVLLLLPLQGHAENTITQVTSPAFSASEPVLTTVGSQALVITTDSLAYCEQLNQTLDEKLRMPHDITVGAMQDALHLQQRGNMLCHNNHIRGGIVRLRRALVLLKHQKKAQ